MGLHICLFYLQYKNTIQIRHNKIIKVEEKEEDRSCLFIIIVS